MRAHDRIRAGVLIVSIISVMSFMVHSTLLSAKTKHDADTAAAKAPNPLPPLPAPGGELVSVPVDRAAVAIGDPFRPVLPDENGVQPGTQPPPIGATVAPAGFGRANAPIGSGYIPAPTGIETHRIGLKLEGVVVNGKSLAVLSAGETHFYAMKGDTVGDGFVVASINREGAVLIKNSRRYIVQIGDSLDDFLVSAVVHR